MIYAKIDLINSGDVAIERHGVISEMEVRSVSVKVIVGSSSEYLYINEVTQQKLGLPFRERRKFRLTDNSIVEYDVVGPVDIRFENRRCITTAIVLPGDNEMVLGAINMADMDVVMDRHRKKLIVNPEHPDMPQMKLKNVKISGMCY